MTDKISCSDGHVWAGGNDWFPYKTLLFPIQLGSLADELVAAWLLKCLYYTRHRKDKDRIEQEKCKSGI